MNITEEREKEIIATSPAPLVSKEYIQSRIEKFSYHKIHENVLVCSITLDNGFSVRGESACVNPENFNEELGAINSYKDAFNQLWPLFGFLLAEDQFRNKKV